MLGCYVYHYVYHRQHRHKVCKDLPGYHQPNFTVTKAIINIILCDRSQENVMNAYGSFYSVVVDSQSKKIMTINTNRQNILGVFHKKVILEGK
jgi:hypothetical protein